MRILFDQGTPQPLRKELVGHDVFTTYELGWSDISNGDLLTRAEGQFTLLITTDQNLRDQQNLTGRTLAVLVLSTTSWPRIERQVEQVRNAIQHLKAGDYLELTIPD